MKKDTQDKGSYYLYHSSRSSCRL